LSICKKTTVFEREEYAIEKRIMFTIVKRLYRNCKIAQKYMLGFVYEFTLYFFYELLAEPIIIIWDPVVKVADSDPTWKIYNHKNFFSSQCLLVNIGEKNLTIVNW